MEKIELSYGTDSKWVKHFASSIKGKIKDSFIVAPESLLSGTMCFWIAKMG